MWCSLRWFTFREIAKNSIKIRRGQIGESQNNPFTLVSVLTNIKKVYSVYGQFGGRHITDLTIKTTKKNFKNIPRL